MAAASYQGGGDRLLLCALRQLAHRLRAHGLAQAAVAVEMQHLLTPLAVHLRARAGLGRAQLGHIGRQAGQAVGVDAAQIGAQQQAGRVGGGC